MLPKRIKISRSTSHSDAASLSIMNLKGIGIYICLVMSTETWVCGRLVVPVPDTQFLFLIWRSCMHNVLRLRRSKGLCRRDLGGQEHTKYPRRDEGRKFQQSAARRDGAGSWQYVCEVMAKTQVSPGGRLMQ